MKISALIGKVSREVGLRCNLKSQTQKLSPLISRHQPWHRAYATAVGEGVTVKSREMIKPSSPTLPHNKIVRFSLLDQITISCYSPILLFYQNDPNNPFNSTKQSTLLKESLSETLVDFHPLAGRIQQNELIDCNDEGAEFCVAHPSKNLLHYMENPVLLELQALMPFQELVPFQGTPRNKNIVLGVQVNHFSCGGIAIGVCLSHKIADGASVVDFLKAWANKAQHIHNGNNECHVWIPKFTGATLFPPLEELTYQATPLTEIQDDFLPKERMALRRLIFDKKTIDGLKMAASNGNTIFRPSKVEVVTAFIHKHWPKKVSSIVQIVNLRKRMSPPIPEDFMGNCAWYTRTTPLTAVENRPELTTIEELRKAINKLGSNYMKELLSRDNFVLQLKKETDALFDRPDELIINNSMSGFPLHEVNFGMGKPIWACVPGTFVKNSVLAMSTQCGQGIEAWISMLEDDIAKLDNSLKHLDSPILKPLQMK